MLLQFRFDIEILVLLDKDDNFKILRDFNVRFRYEKNSLINLSIQFGENKSYNNYTLTGLDFIDYKRKIFMFKESDIIGIRLFLNNRFHKHK